tara:strand:+ start:314 stop:679 length:366 start_codon:yes stop_codon:yes gene_type:complete
MKLNDHTEMKLLSMAFTYHLIKELEVGAIDEINKLNATERYKGCCASHDFCDSNIVMDSALESLGYDTNTTSNLEARRLLINDAWRRAIKLQFNPENVDGCDCLGACFCLPIPSNHKVFSI